MSASTIALFVIVSFAMLVTVHVLGSVRLAAHSPRWNGFVALLIPPIFPYFAVKQRARLEQLRDGADRLIPGPAAAPL